MNFEIKRTKEKYETTYKTIYIRQNLIDQIEKIASEHQTSFNNVVTVSYTHLEVYKRQQLLHQIHEAGSQWKWSPRMTERKTLLCDAEDEKAEQPFGCSAFSSIFVILLDK